MPVSKVTLVSKQSIDMLASCFSESVRTTMCLIAVLSCTAVHAESWQIVMKSQDGKLAWTVDEDLGVLMTMQSQPNLAMAFRTDLQQTIYMNRRSTVHAVQKWTDGPAAADPAQLLPDAQRQQLQQGLAEARQRLKNLPPQARKYAEELLAGKTKGLVSDQTKSVITYQPTGDKKRIGKHQTTHIIELADGSPTGQQFWVAQLPGWKQAADVMEEAFKHFRGQGNKSVSYTELNGIPLRMVDANGRVTTLVTFKSITIDDSQMQPAAKSKEIPLVQFMQASGRSRRQRSNR